LLQFDLSAPWRDQPLAVVDVETTGLDAGDCRVIEIGIVRFERGEVAERWGTLVHTGSPLPAEITQVTGITDEMLAGKPRFREVAWEVYGRLRDRVVVAYNLPFDRSFIDAELARAGLVLPELPGLDPLVWARALLPNARSRKLGALCELLGVDLRQAHRAVDDAEAAGRVLLRLGDKVPATLGELLSQQAAWSEEQEKAFQERKGRRGPAPAAVSAEPPPPVRQKGLF